MPMQVIFPSLQSGIYRISSLFPELYLERRDGGSLRATELDKLSNAQKWKITPDADGTYEITCIRGNYSLSYKTHLSNRKGLARSRQLWTIDPRGISFVIADACDHRVLDLTLDNGVETSDRRNTQGQRWVLHLTELCNASPHPVELPTVHPHYSSGALIPHVPASGNVTVPPGHVLSSCLRPCENGPIDAVADEKVYNMNSSFLLWDEHGVSLGDWRATRKNLTNGSYQLFNLKTGGHLASWPPNSCKIMTYTHLHVGNKDDLHRRFEVTAAVGGEFTIRNTASGDRHLAEGPHLIMDVNTCRLIPVPGNYDIYFISTDMESNPPRVMRDPSNFLKDSTAVTMSTLNMQDFSQMWRFMPL